jgi:hypothetical protein
VINRTLLALSDARPSLAFGEIAEADACSLSADHHEAKLGPTQAGQLAAITPPPILTTIKPCVRFASLAPPRVPEDVRLLTECLAQPVESREIAASYDDAMFHRAVLLQSAWCDPLRLAIPRCSDRG